jgi:hypothetical protein
MEAVAEAEQAGVLVVAALFGGAGGLPGGVGTVLAFAHLLHCGDEDTGLEADDAAEAPLGGGQLADVRLVEGGCGLELLDETGEEGVEFGRVLLGEDGVAGAESVGAGIGGDFGFALGSFGAGGALRVAAVGFDFAF